MGGMSRMSGMSGMSGMMGPGGPPPPLLFHKTAGGASGATTTAVNSTGAQTIVIAVASDGSGTATVSDNLGNVWQETSATAADNAAIQVWQSNSPTTGPGHTFTVSGNLAAMCVAGFRPAVVWEDDNESTGTQASI